MTVESNLSHAQIHHLQKVPHLTANKAPEPCRFVSLTKNEEEKTTWRCIPIDDGISRIGTKPEYFPPNFAFFALLSESGHRGAGLFSLSASSIAKSWWTSDMEKLESIVPPAFFPPSGQMVQHGWQAWQAEHDAKSLSAGHGDECRKTWHRH